MEENMGKGLQVDSHRNKEWENKNMKVLAIQYLSSYFILDVLAVGPTLIWRFDYKWANIFQFLRMFKIGRVLETFDK